MNREKALFLDRDGVINEDSGYPYKPEQIIFRDGIFDFCGAALNKGYILVVVTNQGGIAKGYYTEADVVALHTWMGDRFRDQGIAIAGFYYCPFRPDGVIPEYTKESFMRKPKPGMILQAAQDLNIDIAQSLMLGDKPTDRIELKELKSIIIKGKYSEREYDVTGFEEVKKLI